MSTARRAASDEMDILLIMQGLIYFDRLLILQHCQIKIADSNVVVFQSGNEHRIPIASSEKARFVGVHLFKLPGSRQNWILVVLLALIYILA